MILRSLTTRVISILIATVLLLGAISTLPTFSARAEEAPLTVTLVGQWVNESTAKEDTVKTYSSINDKIGRPAPNPGLLRGLAKIFLGWSDKAPAGNGKITEGARLFSPEDPLSLVFPQGVPSEAKLYGVYFEINDYGEPLGPSHLALLDLLNGADKLAADVNKTSARINAALSDEEILPNTSLKDQATDETTGDRRVIDYYSPQNPDSPLHEVRAGADFTMDDTVALLAYRNQVGSNALRPILSYDYNTRYATDDFPTTDGVSAGYTYVDLNVSIDSAIDVPDTLYLDFSSYSWRPLYVLGPEKQMLEILNPTTGQSLGQGIHAFSSVVSATTPKVRFAVATRGAHDFTVRVILREGDAEKIPESAIIPDAGETIMEEILRNMTLTVLDSDALTQMGIASPTKSVLSISDTKAQELAATSGQHTVPIRGSIQGHVHVSAGKVSFFSLASNVAIAATPSNAIHLGYSHDVVTFMKNTATLGDRGEQNLGQAQVIHGKALATDGLKDDVRPIYSSDPDAAIPGGAAPIEPTFTPEGKSYHFRGWNLQADGQGPWFDEQTKVTSDLTVYAIWSQGYTVSHAFVPAPHLAPNFTLPVGLVERLKDKELREVNPGSVVAPNPDIDLSPFADADNAGSWIFVRWDQSSATIESDHTFTGTWTFLKKSGNPGSTDVPHSGGGTTPSTPSNPAAPVPPSKPSKPAAPADTTPSHTEQTHGRHSSPTQPAASVNKKSLLARTGAQGSVTAALALGLFGIGTVISLRARRHR